MVVEPALDAEPAAIAPLAAAAQPASRHTKNGLWLEAAAIDSASVTHAVLMAVDCGTGFRPPPCLRCRLAHAVEDLLHGSDFEEHLQKTPGLSNLYRFS